MPKKPLTVPSAATVQTPEILPVQLPRVSTGNANIAPFLQGPGTNSLATLSTRSGNVSVDPVTDEAFIEIENSNLSVWIRNYTRLAGFKVSTHKLLDALVLKLTAANTYGQTHNLNTEIRIPLREYFGLLGKQNFSKTALDELRKSVKKDLDILLSTSIEWTEKAKAGRSDGTRDFLRMNLFTSVGIVNSCIVASFSPELAAYLTGSAYIMDYNLRLLSVPEKNQSVYHIGRKLLQQMNLSKKRKGVDDSGILSVRSLLQACPDIPAAEEVTDRHFLRNIISPMEQALNQLVESGVIQWWEYCNPKGAPLSEEQLKSQSFEVLEAAYIRFGTTPDETGPAEE